VKQTKNMFLLVFKWNGLPKLLWERNNGKESIESWNSFVVV